MDLVSNAVDIGFGVAQCFPPYNVWLLFTCIYVIEKKNLFSDFNLIGLKWDGRDFKEIQMLCTHKHSPQWLSCHFARVMET